jgi:GTP-binding protein
MNVNAELAHDAAGLAQFPTDGLPEVAVLGRSNVGKSSFINRLVGRRQLARTSSTPGKTRRIHFYRLEQSVYLVDLPGFGYAAVSRVEQRAWRPLVESYLRGSRPALRGCVLLVDIRRGPQQEERELLDWLAAERIPTQLALTKADKLRAAQLSQRVGEVAKELSLSANDVAVVSSRTGKGLAAVAEWIQEWTGLLLRRPDGSSHD